MEVVKLTSRTHPLAYVALLLALGLLGGCSLLLDWDKDGLPCDNSQCDPGYSCLDSNNSCVADSSLPVDHACTYDIQCAPSLLCGQSPAVCRKACTSLDYQERSECGSGEFCKPEIGRNNQLVGICVESECLVDNECPDSGFACVSITSSANACLHSCGGVNVTLSYGDYSDNCGASEYCQPVGRAGSAQFACLDASRNAALPNQECDLISHPCPAGEHKNDIPASDESYGYACVDGFCRAYCDGTPACGAGFTCSLVQHLLDQGQAFSVCSP